ncbi:MAG: RDD family protein [Nitrospirae bacterium]|nr:RDD family protein [Nitrospirota bacterium]
MSEETKSAGLLLRVVAKTIDFILVAAAAEIIPKAGFFAGLTYLFISDGLFDGNSLGKKLTGLKVISTVSNNPCSIKESILRNFTLCTGMLLSKIPLIGWVLMVLIMAFESIILLGSKERLRLGDELAKTAVIEKKQSN